MRLLSLVSRVLVVGLVAGCTRFSPATPEQLAAALPTEVRGTAVDVEAWSPQDLERHFGSDEFSRAFDAAGESTDGAVAAAANGVGLLIYAYGASRVSGKDLLEAYVETRGSSANSPRFEPVSLASRSVVRMHWPVRDCVEPCIDEAYLYASGSVLFIVQTVDTSTAEAIIEQLP